MSEESDNRKKYMESGCGSCLHYSVCQYIEGILVAYQKARLLSKHKDDSWRWIHGFSEFCGQYHFNEEEFKEIYEEDDGTIRKGTLARIRAGDVLELKKAG